MRDGEHAGQRAEAEGDDEDQREDDLRHRAAEFEEAARCAAQPAALARDWRRPRKHKQKAAGSAEQRAEIGDQQRSPSSSASRPRPQNHSARSAQTRSPSVERRDGARDVVREAAARSRANLPRSTSPRSSAADRDESGRHEAERAAQRCAAHALVVGRRSTRPSVAAVGRSRARSDRKRGELSSSVGADATSPRRPCSAQELRFFLRRSSTNLFSSMIGS